MIKQTQIEKILKINGVSPSSPEDHIRSVLLSARFDKEEVDAAVMVLRENRNTKQVKVEGLHKVFRSDESLQPQEISALLGIDVDASSFYRPQEEPSTVVGVQYVTIWIVSVIFAVITVLTTMYVNQVGPFHPSNKSSDTNVSQVQNTPE